MRRPARFLSGFVLLALISAQPRVIAQAALGEPASSRDSAFGVGVGAQVSSRLSPESKELAEQIYRTLASLRSPTAVGNAAVGLWMVGRLQVALQLMGKAIADDPANIDNQCNYAAMLTMAGGAKLAIPTLEKLAQKFPTNSTVLNNLGQAYYLTDQEESATKALGRALAVAPQHPQAAATQSRIAESKGDNAQAVALARQAIQGSYSLDKHNRLRKLRYSLTLDDFKDSRPVDPDPLGLQNIIAPPFPTNAVEENRLRREWADFYKQIQARLEGLQKQLNILQAPAQAAAMAQAKAVYEKLGKGELSAMSTTPKSDAPVLPRARKAKLMLELIGKDSAAKLRLARAKEALQARVEQGRALVETEYRAEFNKLSRRDAAQTGEGLGNKSLCDGFVALADKYLSKWSEGREALLRTYQRELRLKLGEEIYWQQFTQPKAEFQATVIKAQMEWLASFNSGIRNDGYIGIQADESCLKQKQSPRGGKLANFNDVHCQYHSELDLGIGTIVTDCDKMVSTLVVGPVKMGMNQDMARGTDFYDSFVSCNVEVSAGKSVGAHVGPLSVEVGAEAGMGVEIGRDGVQDVYVTGKVGASAMDVVSSGAEGRMSLMSGGTSVNLL